MEVHFTQVALDSVKLGGLVLVGMVRFLRS